ncbi:hypothetical protein DL98DRAFT_660171 [Cadophora sp. DSE1049]|nr:hypothetical protein DL98DRAFT_660171 [Cadophora sp. DSE1049]
MKFTSIFTVFTLAATLVSGNPLSTEVDLEKRASCIAFHAGKFFGGTCVDVRKGKQCVNGLLVTACLMSGLPARDCSSISRRRFVYTLVSSNSITPEILAAAKASAPPGYEVGIAPSPSHSDRLESGTMSSRNLLDGLKMDIQGDVNGHRPLSSCNYLLMTITMIALFTRIEEDLKKRRNKLWVRAYVEDEVMRRETRLSLTMLVLGKGGKGEGGRDEDCLEVVVKAFEERAGFGGFVYWGELDVGEDGKMGRWEDGKMGRWEDGKMGRWDLEWRGRRSRRRKRFRLVV